ncbi:MAG TPA: hypothetical protein VNZ26_20325, partial [Vicinamibacterales bacterium]|nr:hypothetical protein [Vicinamibacterales bacterium]
MAKVPRGDEHGDEATLGDRSHVLVGQLLRRHAQTDGFAVTVKPNAHLSMALRLDRNDIDLLEGRFYAQVMAIRGDYNFSPTVSGQNLEQHDNESKLLSSQSRFRWILKPGNDLFVVINRGWVQNLDGASIRSSIGHRPSCSTRLASERWTLMVAHILLAAVLSSGQPTSPTEAAVVFVCEHGAAKSVIATLYFNKIAAERGLKARATYRGVNPQAELSAGALKGLREDGFTVPDRKPSPISQSDVEGASVIFAIGCTLPSTATASGKAGSWDDVPEDRGYGPQRDAIKKHVERLVDELLKKQ